MVVKLEEKMLFNDNEEKNSAMQQIDNGAFYSIKVDEIGKYRVVSWNTVICKRNQFWSITKIFNEYLEKSANMNRYTGQKLIE